MTAALGYVRVSTEEQAGSGLGLDAQRATLTAEAARRGWELQLLTDAGVSAKTLDRPGLNRALEVLAAGDAQVLVVAKLDRISRSVSDFAGLLDVAKRQGWSIVALDVGIDMTTAVGEMVAHIMAALAQWERRVIGERTSAALQAKKAAGARLGRPRQLPRKVLERILAERAAGATLQAIAEGLDRDHVPTVRGGRRWYPSTVRAALRSAALDHQES